MKTAMYARVSSEAQEKQQTIESQLVELRSYAEAQGRGLPVEFVDDGYSGAMLERPELDRLRDAVAAGEVNMILGLCPDRLSRNFLHLGILVEEFGKHGARVVFLNQPAEDTPENRLLVQIQGAVSEYERTKILDRTRRGRQHKARQGLMPGGQRRSGQPVAKCRADWATHAHGASFLANSAGGNPLLRWDFDPCCRCGKLPALWAGGNLAKPAASVRILVRRAGVTGSTAGLFHRCRRMYSTGGNGLDGTACTGSIPSLPVLVHANHRAVCQSVHCTGATSRLYSASISAI